MSIATVAAWLAAPALAGFAFPVAARWLAGAAALACAGWAVRKELQSLAIDLHWDGQAWWWQMPGMPDPQPCHPQVVADFGRWMLLRCALPQGRPGRRWLAVQQRVGIPSQWHALRCALYASRTPR